MILLDESSFQLHWLTAGICGWASMKDAVPPTHDNEMNVVYQGTLSLSDHWVALWLCISPQYSPVYSVSCLLQYSATKGIMSSHKGSKWREAREEDNNFESSCLRHCLPVPRFLLRGLQQWLFVFLYYSFTLQWYLQCQLGFQTQKKKPLNLRLLSGKNSLNLWEWPL